MLTPWDNPAGRTARCGYYLEKYCKAEAAKGAACRACLSAPGHQVLGRGLCTLDQVGRFCKSGALPPPPPPARKVPPGPVWASQLTPLSSAELAQCEAGVTKSTDEGRTWSKPTVLLVNNSIGQCCRPPRARGVATRP